jgi:hypothetical protein
MGGEIHTALNEYGWHQEVSDFFWNSRVSLGCRVTIEARLRRWKRIHVMRTHHVDIPASSILTLFPRGYKVHQGLSFAF